MKKGLFAILIVAILSAAVYGDMDWTKKRAELIGILKSKGIANEKVIAAMNKVERHRFVPEAHQNRSYEDFPLPIGLDQTISQPYIVAFMTESLRLAGKEKVLEIGTGSGYQAAVLGEIAGEVYTIEILCELADRSKALLQELGYKNIFVKCGDGYKGWPDKAPFDAIIVTAAPDHIPQPLIDQLAVGGRMIIPVGETFQNLMLIEKTKEGVATKKVLPVRFVPMTGPGVKETK